MHWIAIVFLFLYCLHLEHEVRRLECKANGMEWAMGTQSSFGYCRTPGVALAEKGRE